MTGYNDQIQKYMDYQRDAFEPFRAFNDVAAQTFERLARQNYAVLGDCIEFAVEQAKLSAHVSDVNDYVGRQIASSKAFGEKLAKRTQEYAEIARVAQDATANVVAEKRAPKKAA